MASYQLATANLQVISAQARYGESPARHGEIIGSGLNQLARRAEARHGEFHQPRNSARHEHSLAARYGEFMQKTPCFAKFTIFRK
jgi:hypothetical protein